MLRRISSWLASFHPFHALVTRSRVNKQGRRSVFCIGGAHKRAPEAPTCRGGGGVYGNPSLENFEILKLGNATLVI